jgi:AAA domain
MGKIISCSAVDVDTRKLVEWIWFPYIPSGRITVLDGDPGLGKSFIALDICARITSGKLLPGESEAAEREPKNVLVCNCEDERGTTIVPRLRAAGACLSRCFFGERVEAAGRRDVVRYLSLPSDEDQLADEIKARQPALVVIDPVMAFLDPEVRTNSDQSVRRALNCLNHMAEATGAAFLLVRHLNKGAGTKAMYRGGGSIGFVGLARSALMVAKHPDDPKECVLLHVKSNLSQKGHTQRFDLQFRRGVGVVRWRGICEITPNQAMREVEPATAVDRAEQLLKTLLADGGEMAVTDIIREAANQKLHVKVVKAASRRLLILKRQKRIGNRSRWYWSMKRQEPTDEEFIARLPTA